MGIFKYILAELRWGQLPQEQLEKIETLSFKEVFNLPYIKSNYFKNY